MHLYYSVYILNRNLCYSVYILNVNFCYSAYILNVNLYYSVYSLNGSFCYCVNILNMNFCYSVFIFERELLPLPAAEADVGVVVINAIRKSAAFGVAVANVLVIPLNEALLKTCSTYEHEHERNKQRNNNQNCLTVQSDSRCD